MPCPSGSRHVWRSLPSAPARELTRTGPSWANGRCSAGLEPRHGVDGPPPLGRDWWPMETRFDAYGYVFIID
jgi:hypothetical protein